MPQKSDVVEIAKYPTELRAGVDINITQDINLEKNKLYLGPLDYSSIESLNVGLEEKNSWLAVAFICFVVGI